jgi:hypothetical protein
MIGAGRSGPMAVPARVSPGVDSASWNDGGATLTTPREVARRRRRAAWTGSVGKGGAKGHEGNGLLAPASRRPPEMVLEGPGAAARAASPRRPGRAAENASDQHHLQGASPTVCHPLPRARAAERGPVAATRGAGPGWRIRSAGVFVITPWSAKRSAVAAMQTRLNP